MTSFYILIQLFFCVTLRVQMMLWKHGKMCKNSKSVSSIVLLIEFYHPLNTYVFALIIASQTVNNLSPPGWTTLLLPFLYWTNKKRIKYSLNRFYGKVDDEGANLILIKFKHFSPFSDDIESICQARSISHSVWYEMNCMYCDIKINICSRAKTKHVNK